jgi:hypothetical protein
VAAIVWSVAWVTCLHVGGSHPAGYLTKAPSSTGIRVVPYLPREGDLIFYDDHNPFWLSLFALAGSGPPLHMGIVVRKADGALAVLEAGPDDTLWVELRDVVPRLHQFHKDYKGTVLIRPCKVSLDPQKSAALTRFAQAQRAKRYALVWLLAQATPFRVRGPLEPFLARTDLGQDAWICSELTVAAGTVAGLCDPRVVRANAVYPRDLVDNQCYDLSAAWHDAAEWTPTTAVAPAAGRRK